MASNDDWVKKYESYKKMDLDTIIQKREEKGEDTTLFLKIKENMPKIDNLKEFLDRQVEEKGKLEEEKTIIEQLKKAPDIMTDMDNKIKELEEQNKQIESKIADIDKKLQEGVENPEEKGKLEEDKKKFQEEYGINQGKMGKYQAEYTKNEKLTRENLGKKFHSIESIDKRLEELDKTIDKCNTICAGLVEGKDISDVMRTLDEKETETPERPEPEAREEAPEPESREEAPAPAREKPAEEKPADSKPISTVEHDPEKSKKTLKERIANAFKKMKDLYKKIFKKEDVVKELKEAEKGEGGSTFKDDLRVDTASEPEKEEAVEEAVKEAEEERHDVVEEMVHEEEKDGIRDEVKDDKVDESKDPAKEPDAGKGIDELESKYLLEVAEHGEKSPEARKIASDLVLRRHVMKESGVEIGKKKDMSYRGDPMKQVEAKAADRNDDDDAR